MYNFRYYPTRDAAVGVSRGWVYVMGPFTQGRVVRLDYLTSFPPASPIAHTTISTYSSIEPARNVVVRDAATWTALWNEMHRDQLASDAFTPAVPPLPDIDFSKEMVLGVFLGMRGSGCYAVTIQRVASSGDKLVVQYQEGTPPPNMACIAMVMYPTHVVRLPRFDGAVEFQLMPSAYIPT